MLHIEVERPSPPSSTPTSLPAPGSVAALAALSRNTSVISSSSSSSSSSSLLLNTPRPGPLRAFSSPRNRSPSGGSSTPTRTRAPLYLTKELLAEKTSDVVSRKLANKSRSNPSPSRLGPDDFQFGNVLGEGSYSTVMAAIYPPTRKAYAIKIIDKGPLARKNVVKIANVERNVLLKLSGHPGIVQLHWAFQDEWSWYFVLDLAPRGELQKQISHLGSISLLCSRWYAAQIIDTTAWMHSRGVIHRDLKPENILLDDHMRIKITDFGSAMIFEAGKDEDSSNSWVGTPQYVPPELLLHNTMCKSSDLWAIGCILYQMISGEFPFQGPSTYLMWANVKTLNYIFPVDFDGVAQDLVARLLVLDPAARLGAGEPGSLNDLSALRTHPFFECLSWESLWTDSMPPISAGLFKQGANTTNPGAASCVEKRREHVADEEQYGDDNGQEGHESVDSNINDPTGAVKFEDGSSADSDVAGLEQEPPDFLRSQSPTANVRDAASFLDESTPSEGPTGRLGGFLETLALSSRSRRPSTTSDSSTLSDPARWMPLLRPSETPVFTSCVQKATRRAFPRQLLPLTASARKALGAQGSKVRLLVLTKTRLLCIKDRDGELVVKKEMLIGGQGCGIGVVTGVEKGDHTFMIQTISKSYTYVTEDPALATRWVKEIGEALPPSLTSHTVSQPTVTERTKLS